MVWLILLVDAEHWKNPAEIEGECGSRQRKLRHFYISVFLLLSKNVLIGSGSFVCTFTMFEQSSFGFLSNGHGLIQESQKLAGHY